MFGSSLLPVDSCTFLTQVVVAVETLVSSRIVINLILTLEDSYWCCGGGIFISVNVEQLHQVSDGEVGREPLHSLGWKIMLCATLWALQVPATYKI